MSPFSRFLRSLRTRRGLRQKQLADRLGYEPSYLSALERSQKGPPRQDFIQRLIKGLELSEEEIAELNQALRDSCRQLVLPAQASDDEYALARLLKGQLGKLMPLQISMIEFALRIPEACSTPRHPSASPKEGRAM